MVLAQGNYPFLDLMWTMLVFFAWVIWFWLLIMIFGDLFRRDISGWAKAGWTVLVIVLPFIGVLVYLITQGKHMAERRQAEARATQSQFDDYVRSVATTSDGGGASDQIEKAKRLLDEGAINDEEYHSLKKKALASR
ncbi:SHOCT domain-containing protein [Amycolatopsis sp. K13G38]|uniref:SHOCT domain-containing protein n=1 Tax=Amycolatopsis acididurans TaxID=2724524 RepID=A0ABX1IXY8_9PSEU|nr:SHOCT domain-containing protein [Amycolatopsis acididurans]